MISLEEKVTKILGWLSEKKAEHVVQFDLSDQNTYTDMIIICEGQADLHVRAIADFVLEKAKESDFPLLSKEGLEYAHWVLIDLGDVIIHIFLPETRDYYDLEGFITNYFKIERKEMQV